MKHLMAELKGGFPEDEDHRPFFGLLLVLVFVVWFYGMYLPYLG